MHKKLDSIEKTIIWNQKRTDENRGDEARITDLSITEAQRNQTRWLARFLSRCFTNRWMSLTAHARHQPCPSELSNYGSKVL